MVAMIKSRIAAPGELFVGSLRRYLLPAHSLTHLLSAGQEADFDLFLS